MLKALRHPPLFRLWLGQALSSIGDEIYRVGLTWLAVGLIGENTGYLNAAQAASLMVLSFIGGKWADRWEPLQTMIRVDLIRGLIVLVPVICSYFWPVSLPLLVIVAVILSALSAFFDPAMQTTLPRFSPDTQTLRAATGLMGTTIRMARMIGPGLIGLLAGLIPPIHFFTMNALSFFASAESVRPLQTLQKEKTSTNSHDPHTRVTFYHALTAGFKSVRLIKGMSFIFIAKAITNCTWTLAYGLGLALMVQHMAPNDTRSFGLVIASYGVGNFLGALYFGNLERRRPALMMFVGYVWLGLGFGLMAFCTNIHALMLATAFTGFSGTMNEVTFFDLIQVKFHLSEMTRAIRLRMALDTTAILITMLISPWLFRWSSPPLVIGFCGGIWVITGLVGLFGYLSRLEL